MGKSSLADGKGDLKNRPRPWHPLQKAAHEGGGVLICVTLSPIPPASNGGCGTPITVVEGFPAEGIFCGDKISNTIFYCGYCNESPSR